jgi:hypothetical protein
LQFVKRRRSLSLRGTLAKGDKREILTARLLMIFRTERKTSHFRKRRKSEREDIFSLINGRLHIVLVTTKIKFVNSSAIFSGKLQHKIFAIYLFYHTSFVNHHESQVVKASMTCLLAFFIESESSGFEASVKSMQ